MLPHGRRLGAHLPVGTYSSVPVFAVAEGPVFEVIEAETTEPDAVEFTLNS